MGFVRLDCTSRTNSSVETRLKYRVRGSFDANSAKIGAFGLFFPEDAIESLGDFRIYPRPGLTYDFRRPAEELRARRDRFLE